MKAVVFDLYETLITEWVCEKYTSRKCAEDLGVAYTLFREVWESLHTQMYTGSCTYGQAIEKICGKADVPLTAEKLKHCITRRNRTKADCLGYRHDDVLQMLDTLKARGYKLALLSNCYSEEAAALRESALYQYFNAVILSYEVGYAKPDPEIYSLCLNKLGLSASDCLYVGDGGSRELYGARDIGMKPLRAMWFLNRYAPKIEPMPFDEVIRPCDVVKICT